MKDYKTQIVYESTTIKNPNYKLWMASSKRYIDKNKKIGYIRIYKNK